MNTNEINDKILIDNMTAEEKFNIYCRIKNIPSENLITELYYEIKTKGNYDNGDYDCISEYSIPDIEQGIGEKFGGYVICLQDLSDNIYDKIDKKYQDIIDIAEKYGIEEFYIKINDISNEYM